MHIILHNLYNPRFSYVRASQIGKLNREIGENGFADCREAYN